MWYNTLMHNAPPVYFQIQFTQQVVFRDQTGTVTHQFEVGDTLRASHDNGRYFVTGVGGIYHDEAARVVSEDEMFNLHKGF
jgi:hypothetical protein